MKPNENKWRVVKRGNGKFYPQIETGFVGPCWPWTPSEFDTLEEAKSVLMKTKQRLETLDKENEETVVFTLP